MQTIQFLDVSEKAKLVKIRGRREPPSEEEVRGCIKFYNIFLRISDQLDKIQGFVNNKMISNISSQYDYAMIVPKR